MKREIIRIDEDKCTGCAECIPNCPEGALQIVDGKARLVRDILCDGLGACLGHCPEGAILVEEREAEAYDEISVMKNVVTAGESVLAAHLAHLREHGETAHLKQAMDYLSSHRDSAHLGKHPAKQFSGCPGSQTMQFEAGKNTTGQDVSTQPSKLTHWPIQLHLIHPAAAHFRGSDLLLAADCVAFSLGDFHRDHLSGKTLTIACPKLDDGQEVYVEKLARLIDEAEIRSITVLIMQVPCCSGLLHLARRALEHTSRKVPIQYSIVSIQGQILQQGSLPE